ncbi:hypothetical protein [Noviherbaspirillum suwonense]|jgi:hypothetical protein|uniref:hypothetical protein n=1 Tax=Noviherbaspirillum suwonense TaxID=1224511 RepID=UPI0024B7B8E0|nr:hypothetical protein [Noviherbaspirillum suwonense]
MAADAVLRSGRQRTGDRHLHCLPAADVVRHRTLRGETCRFSYKDKAARLIYAARLLA